MPPISILSQITERVYNAKTAEEARSIIVEFLTATQVKDRDKMIEGVSKLDNLVQIWKFFSNCLLKFEGHSINKL